MYQDVKDKKAVLHAILEKEGLSFDNVAAIGDDLNDLSLLEAVKLSFAPHDAMPLVQSKVDVILSRDGGRGAVREMIESVIKREGLEKEFINLWL